MSRLVITDLKLYTEFLPTQWHARTLDGRPVYIRYRSGRLSVNVGLVGGTIDDALDTPYMFIEHIEGDRDEISFEAVCRLTGISIAP